MNSSEKTKFRSTKSWKIFRKSLLEERSNTCELCGGKYSGKLTRKLQIHHLDPDNYEDLDPKKFVVICSSDHELVERISKKILSKNTTLKNKEKWYNLLKDFLPYEARKRLEKELND